MAIVCSVCGKKQSGFIQSFPLSKELGSYIICANCNNYKNSMLQNAGKILNQYEEKRIYFDEIL